jgi:hypothetical protein
LRAKRTSLQFPRRHGQGFERRPGNSKVGRALAEFMIRDADAYKLDPSTIEEWVFYSHPSPRHRIFAAMRWRAEHLPDK